MRYLLVLLFAGTAHAVVVTQMFFPSYAGFGETQPSPSADQLNCALFAAPHSVTGATTLTFGVTTAGGTCAMGLYDEAGNIFMGASTSCTSTGSKVTTTTPSVNVVEGALYYLCMCSSSTATRMEGIEMGDASPFRLGDVMNGDGTIRVGTGGSCSTGALPPTLTLPLSALNMKPPVAVIE